MAAENGLLGGAFVDGACDVVNANACNGLQMRDTFFNSTRAFFYSKILSENKKVEVVLDSELHRDQFALLFRP